MMKKKLFLLLLCVILALLPACLAGIWHFGIRALWIMLLTVASAVEPDCIFPPVTAN